MSVNRVKIMEFYSKNQSNLCEAFVQEVELDSWKTLSVKKIESDIKKLDSSQNDTVLKLRNLSNQILLCDNKLELLELFLNY